MNDVYEFDDQRQLDRLVDGELSHDEYQALLAELETTPDGWRRCAMAFLEAQAWTQEFGAIQLDDLSPNKVNTRSDATGRERPWSTRHAVGLMLVMAASFVLVFACGVWWQVGTTVNPKPDLVTSPSDDDVLPAEGDKELSNFTVAEFNAGADVATELLTFVVDRGNGESDRFELPIYDAQNSVARQLLHDTPSMPAEVERALRDSGFQIQRQRQWAPVRLRDGRRVIFPIDELEITPVSNKVFH